MCLLHNCRVIPTGEIIPPISFLETTEGLTFSSGGREGGSDLSDYFIKRKLDRADTTHKLHRNAVCYQCTTAFQS